MPYLVMIMFQIIAKVPVIDIGVQIDSYFNFKTNIFYGKIFSKSSLSLRMGIKQGTQ